MDRFSIYLILAFFAAFDLRADGPPIDSTGHIFCKFISIKLDSKQIKHLQTNRWLILTDVQQKRLHFLNLPKYVDIFDPFHRDCTCGQIYAMWYLPDRIGFCIRDTTKFEISPGDDEINEWYNNDTNFVKHKSANDFYINTIGQLLYKEKIITIKDMMGIIETLKKSKDKRYLTIYQPPTTNNPNSKDILQTKQKIRELLPSDFTVYWM